jgi:hypothetical protein
VLYLNAQEKISLPKRLVLDKLINLCLELLEYLISMRSNKEVVNISTSDNYNLALLIILNIYHIIVLYRDKTDLLKRFIEL